MNRSRYIPHNAYAGLGITANRPRRIYDGHQYYDMFPQPTGTDPIVNPNASVYDTLNFVATVVKKTLRDTKKVAEVLKQKNNLLTCRADFDFFYKHYAYKLDKPGVEQVRRPARAWRDRAAGIDCDCFATSVSSILTNQGIDHYLKIIAINGRDYFQHIYVIVPKFKGADITKRGQYWVIDPVLNSFDEEAPNITKTDHLFMEGIQLQYLNGVDDAAAAGLGKEFDTLENSLNGVDDLEGLDSATFGAFRKRLHAHVRNTHNHIVTKPSSVVAVYEPKALAGLYEEAEKAFHGTSDDELIGRLTAIAMREHNALQPRFRGSENAVHVHDDHLYGAMYGETDENMIHSFAGLGSLGKAKAKKSSANNSVKKSGPLTKLKNAAAKAKAVTKNAKADLKKAGAKTKAAVNNAAKKTGQALKKIGKAVVKNNPVSIAARTGFLVAMRTNFGKIAEKAYWGYQTKAFAQSKGITSDYYGKCVALLAKITDIFHNKLKGDESALKKAIVNGRAAKKVGVAVKKKGMKGLGELMCLQGDTLGSVSAATITAALSFLTPLIEFVNKTFKRKKKDANGNLVDVLENENGTDSPLLPMDPGQIPVAEVKEELIKEAESPANTVKQDDGSVEAAAKTNEAPPSQTPDKGSSDSTSSSSASSDNSGSSPTGRGANASAPSDTNASAEQKDADSTADDAKPAENKSKAGLVLLGIFGAAGLAALALGGKKKEKKPALNGIEDFAGVKTKRKKKSKKVKAVKI